MALPNEFLEMASPVLSGASGLPPISGGNAGPSSASGVQTVTMASPFSVAGAGGKASASTDMDGSPMSLLSIETLGFLAVMALLAAFVVKKKA